MAAEFLLAKASYKAMTGREQKKGEDVLCYQIRQSFYPGEITPEEANRVSYELAMRWTKGRHAFIVTTHTDKKHIHSHIYYNSTTLDCTRKFRNFWGSSFALRRLSDRLCLENGLSIVENPKPRSKGKFRNYGEWQAGKKKPLTYQDRLRAAIDTALAKRPADFPAFLSLMEQAGYEVSDITNFETLKKVADDIHARAAELGFDAFTSAGLDGSSSWRFSGHLANMPLFYEFRDDNVTTKPATIKGSYLANYKNIWDLYTTDSATTGAALTTATGDQAEAEFGQGKAVFYQNGTWEFSALTGDEKGFKMNPDDLTMIPIYCGVEGEEQAGLCTGTENYWSINKNASEADINATIDFLTWVVTSDEGTTMMAEQFGACPFKSSKAPSNPFSELANEYVAGGKYPVTWAFNYTPNVNDWRDGVVDALTQYTTGSADWSVVETAFVNGWATQYAAETNS